MPAAFASMHSLSNGGTRPMTSCSSSVPSSSSSSSSSSSLLKMHHADLRMRRQRQCNSGSRVSCRSGQGILIKSRRLSLVSENHQWYQRQQGMCQRRNMRFPTCIADAKSVSSTIRKESYKSMYNYKAIFNAERMKEQKRRQVRILRASSSSSSPLGEAKMEDSFDYIIIGGGASGCTVARRLAEEQRKQSSSSVKKKILLLEDGGGGGGQVVRTPAGIVRLFRDPERDYAFDTEPQIELGGRRIYLARGRGLGGSSSTNAALYHRGSRLDYDSWNLPDWAGEDVLPFFLKSEDNRRDGLAASSRYHSVGGPQAVEDPRYESELARRFVDSFTKVQGLPKKTDFNNWDESQEGAGRYQLTMKNGRRCDTWGGFLESEMKSMSDVLEIKTRTRALKILFERAKNSNTNRAIGVEVMDAPIFASSTASSPSQQSYVLRLKNGGKIICCAGAVHTPYLLLHSGIGSQETLRNHGIETIVDLPGVGRNLQDQPACVSTFKLLKRGMSVTDHVYIRGSGKLHPRALLNYIFRRRGPLASTGCEQGGYLRTRDNLDQPDCQIRFLSAFALDPDGVSTYTKFGQMKASGEEWPPGVSFQIIAIRPKSRGHVTIGESDPKTDRPRVSPCYLSDPNGEDLATMRRGLELSRRWISESDAWGEGVIGEEAYPGVGEHDLESYIKRTLHTSNALVGTCRMGVVREDMRDGDDIDEIVVNATNLHLRGVENVVIADASVIPSIPGGQTVAPTIMIAERAADFILKDKGSRSAAESSSHVRRSVKEIVAMGQ